MNLIVVFVKAPVPGLVKTRLCPPLSEAQAALLYSSFAKDTVESAGRVPGSAVRVAYAPGKGFKSADWICAGPPVVHFRQQGRDLGERLAHAFEKAFSEGAQKVVAIGSDMPQLSHETISEAFSLLDREDVAIGPAQDGGYYLIGLKRAHAGLFRSISWSTDKVFQETAERAGQLGLRMAALPTSADIDTFPDLVRLSRKLQDSRGTSCPATRRALRCVMETTNGTLFV